MSNYAEFRSFLREQGCEAAFDRAFYIFNGCTMLDVSLWEAGDAECIFAHAFDWNTTPEGRDYWLALDKKWGRIVARFEKF